MGGSGRWHHFQQWHELLDAVCIEQKHLDNMRLADELCAVSGNRSGAAFEAALRNLRNWRQGSHIPQRRNFLLLTTVLRIDSYDGLRDHWTRLYGESRLRGESIPTAGSIPDGKTAPRGLRWKIAGMFASIIALTGAAAYSAIQIYHPGGTEATMEFHRNVTLIVGESKIIHGKRSSCGKFPPEWEKVQGELPPLSIGTWSDGGKGSRYSRHCRTVTPVRGVVFTATAPGLERINLYGDDITISVAE